MFSIREKKILEIIGTGKVTYDEIEEKLFVTPDKPLDATIAVYNAVGRINRKCEYFDLDWKLLKTKSDGKTIVKKIKC